MQLARNRFIWREINNEAIVLKRLVHVPCAYQFFEGSAMGVKASKAATARKKRAVTQTLKADLVSHAKAPTRELSTAMRVADAEYAAQTRQARLSRQQAADACVEYWNEVFAVEGSFADEYAIL